MEKNSELERRIRKLLTLLRNEENKLTLMKKIWQSQLVKKNISQSSVSGTAHQQQQSQHPQQHHQSTHSHHPTPTPPAHSHHITPTPPAHSLHHHHSHQTPPSSAHSHHSTPPAHAHHQPTLIAAHQQQTHVPPPMILNPPITNNRSYGAPPPPPPPPLGLSSHLPGIHGNHHQPIGYKPVNREMNNQTVAQRIAAAKAALKKQLEKTLLQIVPPKPPPSEMLFIPNANNNEFIYYYGLETVVDFLTGTDQNKTPPEPFVCIQCGSDYTPVWKWPGGMDPNRGGRPAVICESCVSSNMKKKLRDEHTKRLKTAFVKALQQEQEIEQKISSGEPSPPVPALTPPTNPTNNNSQAASVAAAAAAAAAGLTNPLGNSVHGFGNSPVLPQAPPAHSSFLRHGSAANAAAASANAAAAFAASSALFNFSKFTPAQQSLLQAQIQQLAQSLPHNLNPQGLSQPQPAHMLPFAPLLLQYGALMNNRQSMN